MKPGRQTLIDDVTDVVRDMLPGPRGWAVIIICCMLLVALFFYDNWDAINVD